jgi:putrescine:ornithine antiporter
MVLVGVVQSLMALSTISPNLSEQFGALVSLAVVTNVVPYIMAISGLMLMMKKAGTPAAAYRRNVVIALIAMLYSTYAIYASGLDAVLGGMLVMASGYVIYGFIAHRFAAPAGATERIAASIAVALLLLGGATPSGAGTLERVRSAGKLVVGYREDARPFSFEEAGRPVGYAIALCDKVAEQVRVQLGTAVAIEHVAVTSEDRFRAVADGRRPAARRRPCARRRREVAFSIPISQGHGALLHADASSRLRDALQPPVPTSP